MKFDTQEELIRDIRKNCRLAMNGVASTSMRELGLAYKLNFGLVMQQIKDLAGRYDQDASLAEKLWKEETRELKILATLLYPNESYKEDVADRWVKEIPNQEIREQICANLFTHLPYATDIALKWANNANEDIRTTAYWLLGRLYLSKKMTAILKLESFELIWQDTISENIFLRNAALLVLKQIGRNKKEVADQILEKLANYKDSEKPIESEAYNNVAFEFDFFFG